MSIFESIKQGLKEAVEYSETGKVKGKPVKIHEIGDVDVKRIRSKFKMTQSDFARAFGLNLKSVQNWEQKRKVPTGASLVLLKVIEKDPEAVLKALYQN
ncbi:transcriptional regulator [Thiotrichales bacterium 19S11-10]|nr:transcriptional regulator [Thiotrichales bacterium 19S11-10]MCF6808388.1 transcriptional regulator [Thiotrichales bacterium 19S9-11]MCF6812358.1 transcriptional regulator [Thiotrichales bacterium 19S9-12]